MQPSSRRTGLLEENGIGCHPHRRLCGEHASEQLRQHCSRQRTRGIEIAAGDARLQQGIEVATLFCRQKNTIAFLGTTYRFRWWRTKLLPQLRCGGGARILHRLHRICARPACKSMEGGCKRMPMTLTYCFVPFAECRMSRMPPDD
ncbi:hypothetical protein D3C81_1425190 [compost metagenome]